MTWHGRPLTGDERDVAELIDSLAADRAVVLDDAETATIEALRGTLAELGVWTMGVGEAAGGGGADRSIVQVATERLGRYWPALAWAFVQTQVAGDLLAPSEHPAAQQALRGLHAGTTSVAVVELGTTRARLEADGARLVGDVDRVDVASPTPELLALAVDSAYLVPAPAVRTPLERTGLGGALTRSVAVDAAIGAEAVQLASTDWSDAVTRLRLGGAAVAAGIAGAAADQALSYSASRQQFGGPLTRLPTVRQSLFGQAGATAVALGGALIATPVTAHAPMIAAGILQRASDAAVEVCAQALQSHGGYGYLTEYPAERYLRDAISLRAAVDAFGTGVAGGRELVA